MTFTYGGDTLELFDHPYNTTRKNERAVEIPLARRFIAEHGIDLEIGNVLGHYGHHGHRVVDRYEETAGVENSDVFDLIIPTGTVVAISTLEHVRWDEPGDRDPLGGIDALERLLNIADRLFVTVPLGHNLALDGWLLRAPHGATRAATLVRNGNGWLQTVQPEWKPYGSSTIWAESVWIGEWT